MEPLASAAAAQYAHHARLQLLHGVELLTELAQPRAGETVVDVGCGCGELTWLAAHAVASTSGGGRVLGVDPDAARIALCRDRGTSDIVLSLLSDIRAMPMPSVDGGGDVCGDQSLPTAAVSVRAEAIVPPSFAVGDASQLLDVAAAAGIARGTVDLVFANHVVHWIADKVGFFHQALHLLRPGGRLVLQSPARDTRLLTRLTKLAHKSVGDRLARAISVADATKLMRAAHAVGFDARPAHESVVVHRQRFESAAHLFEWMGARFICCGV
jgi:trans-aconitate methyltransferase